MDILSIFHIATAFAAEEAVHAAADPSIAGTFGLNVKVFIAQLVNFGIVVLVLWKWVLTPIAKKLAEREAKISEGLSFSEEMTKQKEEMEKSLKEELSQAKIRASEIITEAKKEADKLKAETLESTKQEEQKILQRAKEELHEAEASALNDAKNHIAELVIQATQKVLEKKLDPATDKEIIKSAISDILKKN